MGIRADHARFDVLTLRGCFLAERALKSTTRHSISNFLFRFSNYLPDLVSDSPSSVCYNIHTSTIFTFCSLGYFSLSENISKRTFVQDRVRATNRRYGISPSSDIHRLSTPRIGRNLCELGIPLSYCRDLCDFALLHVILCLHLDRRLRAGRGETRVAFQLLCVVSFCPCLTVCRCLSPNNVVRLLRE